MAEQLNVNLPVVNLSDSMNSSITSNALSVSYTNTSPLRQLDNVKSQNDSFDIQSTPVVILENNNDIHWQFYEIQPESKILNNDLEQHHVDQEINELKTNHEKSKSATQNSNTENLDYYDLEEHNVDQATNQLNINHEKSKSKTKTSTIIKENRQETLTDSIKAVKEINTLENENGDIQEQENIGETVISKKLENENGDIQEQENIAEPGISKKNTRRKQKIFAVNTEDNLIVDESGCIKNLNEKNLNTPNSPQINPKTRFVSRISKDVKREPKLHSCHFCKHLIVDQIRRHIINVHANEKVLLDAEKLGADVKRSVVNNLINLGDYEYNNSLKTEGEEIIVARRPNRRQVIKPKQDEKGTVIWPKVVADMPKDAIVIESSKSDVPKIFNYGLSTKETGNDYVPCKYCMKTMKRSTLVKHKCPQKKHLPQQRGFTQECDNLIPDIHPSANQRLRDLVIKQMQKGHIKDIVKQDPFIAQYGNELVNYYNKDQDYSMISHQLRLLAELLYIARNKCDEIKEFENILDFKRATLITDSVKDMADYDEASATLEKCNKAREMNTLLNKVIDFFINNCIEAGNDAKEQSAEKLKKLLKNKFKELNKKSRECYLKQAKSKAPKKIPKIEDISKLVKYTENIRQDAHCKLLQQYDKEAYVNLNKSTLILLQVFNRKRQGEVSRLLLEDLKDSCMYKLDDDCNGDEFVALNKECRKAAENYVRVSITNKKGLMNVGLIIHKKLLNSINLIIKYRDQALDNKKNKYVFARNGYNEKIDKCYEAYIIMREYSTSCGVKDHKFLRGTLMRRQVATMMYGLDISDSNLRDLATFLGHDWEIHKNYYRQRIPVRELINLTPLLEQAQGIAGPSSSSVLNNSNNELFINKQNENESTSSEYNPLDSSQDTLDDEGSGHDTSQNSSDNNNNYFAKRKNGRKEKRETKRKRKQTDSSDEEKETTKKKKKISWTDEERNAIEEFVAKNGLPKKVTTEVIEEMKKEYPILESRDVLKIRAFMHNSRLVKKTV